MRAIQIREFGGPEVLELVEVDPPVPVPGEVLIDVDSAGVNFADTHQTRNAYLTEQHLPLTPGSEVVGRVRGGALDGRRVVALTGGGGYAEQVVAPAGLVYPIPDQLDDVSALALVLQGLSAWHLLRTCAGVGAGESVVVQAAAGGVGIFAVQLAKQWGAGTVIGAASTPEKRRLAESLGADVTVDLSTASDAGQVRELLLTANGGKAVDVVLEMTGGHVFDGCLQALAPMGRLVVYGMASGKPASPISATELTATSRTVTGFWLVHALRRLDAFMPAIEELASLVRTGRLRTVAAGTYPLAEAARAHADLLARGTAGKLVLQVR